MARKTKENVIIFSSSQSPPQPIIFWNIYCFPWQILPKKIFSLYIFVGFSMLYKSLRIVNNMFYQEYQSCGVVIFHPNEMTSNTLTYATVETYRSFTRCLQTPNVHPEIRNIFFQGRDKTGQTHLTGSSMSQAMGKSASFPFSNLKNVN